ncbi:hypothetical protein E4T50_03188 [Aureobasidium sp. EXF-12298]|nr:hypothetical protein E4T50_03188 [Aureobasidium sp. EXF-12298]
MVTILRPASDSSRSATRSLSEPEKTQSEVTPPYSEDGNSPAKQHQHEAPHQLESFGHLRISKDGTSYFGSSHWATILNSICELKRDLEDSGDEASDDDFDAWRNEEPLNAYDEELPGLLRSPRRVTKAELLSYMPPKVEADALVSLWFRVPHPYKAIIHAPQFQHEYRQFWRSPTSAPVMWLGVLYGMFGMASLFKLRALRNPNTPEVRATIRKADLYQELTASAAVLGNYLKPKTYTIECLILHAGGSMNNNPNDVWLLMGIVFRLALRMGYHRDPSHYSNISVLAGEMRRRVWYLLYMFDTLGSFQLGLPAMLRAVQSDTQPPHNLFDQDFSIHSKTLPPPRPVEQLTPSAYGASKTRLVQVFALAADMSHATTPPSYAEVLELDTKLDATKATIPPGLRFQDELCLTEDPESLMCRFGLDLVYLKAKIVLHRRFMVASASQAAVTYSRNCCIDSAMKILEHHRTIYRASHPGGQLESVSWYMCFMGTYDFLLASIIICLELARQLTEQPDPETDKIATRADMVAALEASKKVWEEAGEDDFEPALGSDRPGQMIENAAVGEIKKACKAMTIMLEKIRMDKSRDVAPPASRGTDFTQMSMPEELMTTSSVLPASNGWPATDQWAAQHDFVNLDNMIDVSNDINWEMWDQQFSTQQEQQQLDQFTWTVNDMLAAGAPGLPEMDMNLG